MGAEWFDKIEWEPRGAFHTTRSEPLRGSPVVILGGGPGLTPEHLQALHTARRAILVNNAYIVWPHRAPVVALDRRWWEWHGRDVAERKHLPITALRPGQNIPVPKDLIVLEKDSGVGFSEDRDTLTGRNSGHAAICLSVILGASEIYLAGFDMGFQGARTHWHEGHKIPSSESNYTRRFRPALEELVRTLHDRGVSVSAITPSAADIPKTPFDAALMDLKASPCPLPEEQLG